MSSFFVFFIGLSLGLKRSEAKYGDVEHRNWKGLRSSSGVSELEPLVSSRRCRPGYADEGLVGYCVQGGPFCGATKPLYRFFSADASDHLLTTREKDIMALTAGSRGPVHCCLSARGHRLLDMAQLLTTSFLSPSLSLSVRKYNCKQGDQMEATVNRSFASITISAFKRRGNWKRPATHAAGWQKEATSHSTGNPRRK